MVYAPIFFRFHHLEKYPALAGQTITQPKTGVLAEKALLAIEESAPSGR
jgi:hypothetical protein